MTSMLDKSPMIGLLQAALNNPIERSRLMQEQKKLREIMNDVPARQWLYEKACQNNNPNQANPAQDIIIQIMISSRLIWCGGGISRDVYSEALSRNWVWFTKNLLQYEPEKSSFVTWFNRKLRYEILEVIRERQKEEKKRRNPPDNEENNESIYPEAPDPDRWHETIQEWLDLVQSNSNLLNCRMQNYPHVNCQVLLIDILNLLKHSEDFCWDDLAQKYDVEPSVLKRFCKTRCFRNFKQLLPE